MSADDKYNVAGIEFRFLKPVGELGGVHGSAKGVEEDFRGAGMLFPGVEACRNDFTGLAGDVA